MLIISGTVTIHLMRIAYIAIAVTLHILGILAATLLHICFYTLDLQLGRPGQIEE